ncbi:hypothetical protein C2G38_1430814 [Gigaspora rosea]|uniref:DUF4218 domain-containing protein n=1 Tax=Gigaspora rosea TaxID=44941 RepID=A0A397VDR6_9GLOM|nr:hypothetical protein C2G38_1430814 [Gigaspora rosea]
MPKRIWEKIGEIMDKNKNNKTMPSEFGRLPTNIYRYSNSFKDEEWTNWTCLYSLPLLVNYLKNPRLLNGWAAYVLACRICIKHTITQNELANISKSFQEFWKSYERDYTKKDISRLPAFKIVFHYLLHIQESIKDCGPCWAFWQYPIEHLYGMLQPMVCSRLYPYKNLVNSIIIMERFNHLKYLPKFHDQIFPKEEKKQYNDNQVFALDNNVEEL